MSVKEPLISVIVPIYNVAPYLQDCVNSILKQTYRHLEIILVDDGSTDGSAQLCDEIAQNDSRVIVIHQKNMGLVQARINGINHATGEYATYVDGDDWLEKYAYEHLIFRMSEERPDILTYALIEEFSDHKKIITDEVPEGLYKDTAMGKLRRQVLFKDDIGRRGVLYNLVVKIVKTDLLRRSQSMVPADISIGEDTLCTFMMFLRAETVQITQEPLYHYRRHNSSMMSKAMSPEKCVHMFNHLKKIANDFGRYSDYKKAIIQYMYFLILLKNPGILFEMKDNPYKVDKKDDIVIYGAGEFGKELKVCLQEMGYRIVMWVDRRYEYLQQEGLKVYGIEAILWERYDYILIAVLDTDTQDKIKKNLCELGIEEKKIRTIRTDEEYLALVEDRVDKGEYICFN